MGRGGRGALVHATPAAEGSSATKMASFSKSRVQELGLGGGVVRTGTPQHKTHPRVFKKKSAGDEGAFGWSGGLAFHLLKVAQRGKCDR